MGLPEEGEPFIFCDLCPERRLDLARILVIDDEAQMRWMLREMLEQAGYEVMEASNGKDGVELYRKDPPDLVITDIVMPEKDGLAVIEELRREYLDAKIIATAGFGNVVLPRARELKADRTFSKPFRVVELLAAVKELLG